VKEKKLETENTCLLFLFCDAAPETQLSAGDCLDTQDSQRGSHGEPLVKSFARVPCHLGNRHLLRENLGLFDLPEFKTNSTILKHISTRGKERKITIIKIVRKRSHKRGKRRGTSSPSFKIWCSMNLTCFTGAKISSEFSSIVQSVKRTLGFT